MDNERLYDVPTTRTIIGGIGLTAFYALLRDGHLKAVKMGRRTFCRGRDIQEYLDTLESYPSKAEV